MYQSISRYRILERLGSGGEGQVWKAEDLKLKRTVAIKLLAPNLVRDEEATARLQAEAQMAAALAHPNIATVYELGEAGDQPYIVMEYVDGETLKAIAERGPIDLNEALEIGTEVGEALKAAHARGLLHCDLKSSNIMITPNGLIKVLDFGLARVPSVTVQGASHDGFNTQAGSAELSDKKCSGFTSVISGTLGSMSPEQVRGEALDCRTDVFSLGAVLYEMLTARLPFDGQGPIEILHSVLNDEPAPLSAFREDVPLELESVIRRALAKRREERYANIQNLVSDLRGLRAQIANKSASEARSVSDQGSGNAIDDSSPIDLDRFSSLRAAVVRWRGLLQLGGGLAASMAMWEVIALKPQGADWAIVAGLVAIAAACGFGFVAAKPGASRTSGTTRSGTAFRGLLPFQEADRNRFYGRETDTPALFEMIRHGDFRFGVLFGESGCGKTSLLRAGLLPKLWEEGYVPVYCRSYKDPLGAALDECRKLSEVNAVEGEPPTQYLRRVAREMSATLVIICDQFEEFFVSHKLEQEREPFLSFIAASHDDPDLPVKFLVSMRSDFLYLISAELGGRVVEPLISSRIYHLRNFDEEHAIEIIEKSATRAGLPFERGLSRQVARDLASGDVISPSELQIVGAQLQSKRIYTLQAYRRAGGKEPLVHRFVEDIIQGSGDMEGARLLLRSLISDENTRVTWPLEQIALRTQRNTATVERLLRVFVKSRLIREIQDETPWRYELMHEYLIDKINQVTGSVMDATQRANRLLRQYISNYSVDKRTNIPISKLWFIRRYSDIARGERERELIRKSFRLGLVKAAALVILLTAAAAAAAAALSIGEEWESVRLSDGHTAAVRQAVFSPDGKLLLSCGEDNKVIVWDFVRRDRLATLEDHEGVVTGVAFSLDGKWFATSSMDGNVIVWDRARLQKAFVLRGHRSGVGGLAFSTDARFLVSTGVEAISWRVGTFEKVAEMPQSVTGVPAFLPRSSKFTISPNNYEITFVDAATGKLETRNVAELRQGWLAVSPDGKLRIAIDGGGFVQFVALERNKILKTVEAHKDNGRSVAFSPDGNLAASAAENVILWDARTQSKIASLEYDSLVWSVTFSPDGRWLISTHADGAILVWDVAERQRVANLNEHSAAVYGVAYSPDGKRIASSSEDSSVIIWNAATGRKEGVLVGHRSKANGVAFLPDGNRLISCGFLEPSILWDIERAEVLRTFVSQDPMMPGSNGFAISTDGRWVATSHEVDDIEDGRVVCSLLDKAQNDNSADDWLSRSSQIYGISFSHDGRRLACATVIGGDIGLLDTVTWEVVAHAQAPDSPFISLSFSPDGRYLATGDDFGQVELWSVDPLERIAIIGRHAARVKAVAFSPDGKQIVSSSDDKTIALWNVGSRNLAARIGTHSAPVRSVAFSPDGKHIVSGEHDRSVRIHTRHRVLWGFRLD
jgi:WD40 repeat protein/serine/threonine protein kinase